MWKISVYERPVRRGKFICELFNGKALSHVFLVLENSENKKIEEIHGDWKIADIKIDYGRKKHGHLDELIESSFFYIGFLKKPLCSIFFNIATISGKFPTNYMYKTKNLTRTSKQVRAGTVFYGSHDEVVRIWNGFNEHIEKINDERLTYNRYALHGCHNCQTSLFSLLSMAGLRKSFTFKYYVPEQAKQSQIPVFNMAEKCGR